jgi:GntR family transcriptional regulator
MDADRGGARPLDRSSPVPLWAQLHEDLRRRSEAGEFADAFPPEMDLVAQYEVSRNTVREAMRRLRSDGLVVASRGRRPRLAEDTEIVQPLGALYSLFASVEASGLEQRSEVRALEVRTDADAAGHLGRPAAQPLLYLERLRLAGGEPLALDRVWVPEDLGAPLLSVDFAHTGFYDEFLDRAGIALSGGREQIRAMVPSADDCSLLGLRKHGAALAIERLGCAKGEPVEWRHTLVRGDRFSVMAEFSARGGYQLDVSGLSEHD